MMTNIAGPHLSKPLNNGSPTSFVKTQNADHSTKTFNSTLSIRQANGTSTRLISEMILTASLDRCKTTKTKNKTKKQHKRPTQPCKQTITDMHKQNQI